MGMGPGAPDATRDYVTVVPGVLDHGSTFVTCRQHTRCCVSVWVSPCLSVYVCITTMIRCCALILCACPLWVVQATPSLELADAFLADFSDGEGDDQGGEEDGTDVSSDGAEVGGGEGSGSDDESEDDEAATKQALTYEMVTKLLHDPRLPAHVQVHHRRSVCLWSAFNLDGRSCLCPRF